MSVEELITRLQQETQSLKAEVRNEEGDTLYDLVYCTRTRCIHLIFHNPEPKD